MSALGLQRVLGLKSYETAWVWMHKLRRAMVVPERDLLSGTVEVDETLGGRVSRNNSGRASDKIAMMVVAGSLGQNRIGRIRLEPTPSANLPSSTSRNASSSPGR